MIDKRKNCLSVLLITIAPSQQSCHIHWFSSEIADLLFQISIFLSLILMQFENDSIDLAIQISFCFFLIFTRFEMESLISRQHLHFLPMTLRNKKPKEQSFAERRGGKSSIWDIAVQGNILHSLKIIIIAILIRCIEKKQFAAHTEQTALYTRQFYMNI